MDQAARDARMAELILYIAQKMEDEPGFGATVLNKALFYADFEFYARSGRSITEQEYQRLPNGPAPRRLKPVLSALIKGKRAGEQTRKRGSYTQQRTIALDEPRLEMFDGEEIAVVDHVIDQLRGMGAKNVSDLSHRFVGWQVAFDGDTIPYETVFLSSRPLTEAEVDYARELENADRAAPSLPNQRNPAVCAA